MALMKIAAGLAVGYVLGSRAGREKYEQIAATARRISAHPTAVQAQEKAKEMLGSTTAGRPATPVTRPAPGLAQPGHARADSPV